MIAEIAGIFTGQPDRTETTLYFKDAGIQSLRSVVCWKVTVTGQCRRHVYICTRVHVLGAYTCTSKMNFTESYVYVWCARHEKLPKSIATQSVSVQILTAQSQACK